MTYAYAPQLPATSVGLTDDQVSQKINNALAAASFATVAQAATIAQQKADAVAQATVQALNALPASLTTEQVQSIADTRASTLVNALPVPLSSTAISTMIGSAISGLPTMTQMNSAVSGILNTSMAPTTEGMTASVGSAGKAAQADHKHPRASSSGQSTTGADGTKAITFLKPFTAAKPQIYITVEGAGAAISWEVVANSWVGDATAGYTGCTIKIYKAVTLPGTLTLLTALVNYNVFPVAANLAFGWLAVPNG